MPTLWVFGLKPARVQIWMWEKKLLRHIPLWMIPEKARQKRAQWQLKYIKQFTEELAKLPIASDPRAATSLDEARRTIRQAQAKVINNLHFLE
jgi:hypothetical protein